MRSHCRTRVAVHLSAAVRAKTILAGCEHVTVLPGDGVRAEGRSGRPALDAVAGLVALNEAPYLLLPRGHPAPSGPMTVFCAGPFDLGTLILTGCCGTPSPATLLPGLAAAFLDGSATAESTIPMAPARWDLEELEVAPLVVERVRVVVVTASAPGQCSLPVPLDLFCRAEADRWALYRHEIVDHLDGHHQRQLCGLVAVTGGPRDATGVTVRDVGPHGLALTCLTAAGVVDHVVPFDPPLLNPAHLAPWIRSTVASQGRAGDTSP